MVTNETNETINSSTTNMKPRAKVRRPGSGRTKGAVSFSTVTLSELNRILQPDAPVVASRKWLEALNAQHKPIRATPGKIEGLAESVDIKINDFSDDYESDNQEQDVPTGLEEEELVHVE